MNRRMTSGTLVVLVVGTLLLGGSAYVVITTALTSPNPWGDTLRVLVVQALLVAGLVTGMRSVRREQSPRDG